MKVLRRSLAAALGAAAVLWPAAPAQAAESPQQKLVHAYSPIVMLRAQEDPPCDTAEEQYEPTTVNRCSGTRGCNLTRPPRKGEPTIVEPAPTAADIAGLGGTATTSTCPATR